MTGIRSLSLWRESSTILLYWPLLDEPDLTPLLEESSRKTFLFPRISGDRLSIHRWNPDANWITGPFGVREPDPETWELVLPGIADLCLVPGVAFDAGGIRLGRGKGFYDRLLGSPSFRARKVGISWESRIVSGLPWEKHDVLMDIVVTEMRIIVPSGLDIPGKRG